MQAYNVSPRAQYRRLQRERMDGAATLETVFARLKSLNAELEYFGPDRTARWSKVRYKVNVAHAKALFRFDCRSQECMEGDFDLSELLAEAVTEGKSALSGELSCAGWRIKNPLGRVPCGHILKYKLALRYK